MDSSQARYLVSKGFSNWLQFQEDFCDFFIDSALIMYWLVQRVTTPCIIYSRELQMYKLQYVQKLWLLFNTEGLYSCID